ncbi:Mpp10 protein, putative [Leishmania lindenbergi]|uniref:Mpp10 protein n=1 Tax=Leishmania lindenbergi TaxID=651832 RepID=A0AAW3A6P1_9TRYP
MPSNSTSASSPGKAMAGPKLGGQLRSSERVLDRLTSSPMDRLVASRRSGDAVLRESLTALYSLATKLHSPALRFASSTIDTRKERHITTEQVWGQLNVLMRPVLRQLGNNVHRARLLYGGSAEGASAKATQQRSRKAKATTDKDDDGDRSADEPDGDVAGKAILSTRTSELDESDLDEEIESLLAKQVERRRLRKEARGGGGGGDDSWRYAFGKENAGEEDDEEDDWDGEGSDHGRLRRRRRQEVEEKVEEEVGMDFEEDVRDGALADQRARDRNLRAMVDAQDDAEPEEDLAALRELYGDDFEDDGRGFLGEEEDEDPDMEEDIELDDPANEAADDAYNERDGAYFGKGDILNDEAGDFEEEHGGYGSCARYGGGEDGDDTGVALQDEAKEMDEELLAALEDPSLSELQKERLREKHMVRKMEEKRLFSTDWSMVGETTASKRPRDALLEVDNLEFEYGMKATPVITEAFTAKLEDRIKQRIQDENYDDVKRKMVLSTEADITHSKYDAALDAQKSKMSLMDLYEKDFLEKQRLADEAAGGPDAARAEPLTEIEKDELRAIQMWQRLAQHLDALSNFHYTPKPVQQDLEARVRAVENQAPAVVIENVGNFATTRENALAPQDLYRGSSHRFADVGIDELTPKERQTLRRSKKEAGKKDKERKEARGKQRADVRKQKQQSTE